VSSQSSNKPVQGAEPIPGQQPVGQQPGSMPPPGMKAPPAIAAAGNKRVEKARDPQTALRRLAAYLQPYAMSLLGAVVLIVITTGLELLGPYLFGVAVDRFIGQKDLNGLVSITLLMLLSYGVAWLTQYGQTYIVVAITQKVLRALRRDLFQRLQLLSLRFFDLHPTGELMSRLTNDIDAIRLVLSQSIVELAASLLTLLGIAIVMFSLNLWLALGALAIMPIMLWFTARVGSGTRRGFREVQTRLGLLNAQMEENTSGARVIQAFRRQDTVINEFDGANNAARDASIRAQSLMMTLRPVLMVLSNIDIAIIAALGGWLILRGSVSIGVVSTFILYTRRFSEPLFSLADLYNSIQSALAGAERVFEIVDQQPEVQDQPGAIELSHTNGFVELDHVNFSYVKDIPVLKDITLSLKPGQRVALVGPTGAGKTTIVNMLTRFYDIDSGEIRIDGHDIRNVKQDSLRQQLGIVLQDTFLFSDTVMENIRYGRLDATDEECIEAARLANADQFIQRLPEGYQTMLSERANNLSQGQRQLISISRAILSDPRVLILDEATSNVDTRTEQQLQEALQRLMVGRTSFVIAHRLSTIRNADLVLVISDGQIVEQGTHDSLLNQKGFYYRLYMSQFARE